MAERKTPKPTVCTTRESTLRQAEIEVGKWRPFCRQLPDEMNQVNIRKFVELKKEET